MSKTTGEQNIPSELLELYRRALGQVNASGVVGKRMPPELPFMQTVGGRPTGKQKTQRGRFIAAVQNYNTLTPTQRARWFNSPAIPGGPAWYVNYFVQSELIGNADIGHGGAGVIKNIQWVTGTVPAGSGEAAANITTVDPTKIVIMLNGASFIHVEGVNGPYVVTVYPYISFISATQIRIKWSTASYAGEDTQSAGVSATVIEYI